MKRAISGLTSLYSWRYPTALVYMLQSTEYNPRAYLAWFWRTNNFSNVMHRRSLDKTRAANLLLFALRFGMTAQILIGIGLILAGTQGLVGGVLFGLALIVAYPVMWAHLVIGVLELGRVAISRPSEQRLIAASERIFAEHPALKIAVAGSYGKTTMKELLLMVLSEGFQVAATPANKNVSVSHAYFARKLLGSEDILIIEYGEGQPGDIARFASITHPTHGIITGLAPAHLDQYKTLEAAGQDIFSLHGYVSPERLFVNTDSPDVASFAEPDFQTFGNAGSLGWSVSVVSIGLQGTNFVLKKNKQVLKLSSGLVGRHQVGFLALVAALSMELGLSAKQVQAGLAKTKPFEHRMQPYALNGGWIIDDTYNGNLEGLRAGTALLAELSAKRKIYITPGLVEQGSETERVHFEAGQLIAAAQPNMVVLMKNSVTTYLQAGLQAANYAGEVRLENDPLEFYTNLNQFVAAGDLVLMQNDWTDNYS